MRTTHNFTLRYWFQSIYGRIEREISGLLKQFIRESLLSWEYVKEPTSISTGMGDPLPSLSEKKVGRR